MTGPLAAVVAAIGQAAARRPTVPKGNPGLGGWLTDSRNAVLVVVAAALVIGGGRKWLQAVRARKLVDRLDHPEPPLDAIAEAPRHRRAAVISLFRLLGTSPSAEVRRAAGQALAVLWKADELIVEEEKAIVSRGFVVDWDARRRYPRALTRPIPLVVRFGLPFLVENPEAVGPTDLEWSWRVLGTERMSLETFSEWAPGPPRAEFELLPGDWRTNGPHRLVLHARVRTRGLTSPWEMDLPQVPFSFEFDPILALDSLFAAPDDSRAPEFDRAVRLEPPAKKDDRSIFRPLNASLAIRDPADLVIRPPLPNDLAHRAEIEVEGIEARLPAGDVVTIARGGEADPPLTFPLLAEIAPFDALDGPGDLMIRVRLIPDAELGWSAPGVRSLWPGEIVTNWCPARVVRI